MRELRPGVCLPGVREEEEAGGGRERSFFEKSVSDGRVDCRSGRFSGPFRKIM